MINLEQDFIKFETDGNSAYYGYTLNPSAADGDNTWAIRLMTGTGSTFDVQWSNNTKLTYTSKWENKEDYFSFDGSYSVGLTYSISDTPYSNDIKNVDVSWTEMPGVDLYKVTIKNNRNNVVNKNNIEIFNTNAQVYTELLTSGRDSMSFRYTGPVGLTYSFILEAFNGFGTLTESFTF
jgi:hypothetical protein